MTTSVIEAMALFFATFAVVALCSALMAIGLWLGRKPLRGSCGGQIHGVADCVACPRRGTERTGAGAENEERWT